MGSEEVVVRRITLFFLTLLCCGSMEAQVATSPITQAPAAKREDSKPAPLSAKLALELAKRWTEAALTDSTNLQPIERDILLVRLADRWKKVDRAKSEEYFKKALDQLREDSAPNGSQQQRSDYSVLLGAVSDEIHGLDPKTWNELVQQLPSWEAKYVTSSEGNELAINNDVAGAMELAEKSLSHGGSIDDISTLESLSEQPEAAAKLFDEILNTAVKPDADLNMLSRLSEEAFRQNNDSDVTAFFNSERQQRLLAVLAQVALTPEMSPSCSFTLGMVEPLMARYPAQTQDQLRSALSNCIQTLGRATGTTPVAAGPTSTDEFVEAMNAASNPKDKARLRMNAAEHAFVSDHDYKRAIQLCLDVSDEERQSGFGSPDMFDRVADSFASRSLDAAEQRNNDSEIEQLVEVLPAGMKAAIELRAVFYLSNRDKPRALAMFADAQAILEIYQPVNTDNYEVDKYGILLADAAELSPASVPSAWRTLVSGLNRIAQLQRMKSQSASAQTGGGQSVWAPRFYLYPLDVPLAAVADENFARASIEDIESVEVREKLRMGGIDSFLTHYENTRKTSPTESKVALTASKN